MSQNPYVWITGVSHGAFQIAAVKAAPLCTKLRDADASNALIALKNDA